MNRGPQQKNMFFFVQSIMCGGCCSNICAEIGRVDGVTAVEASPFDQEKKKGGCLMVSTRLDITAQQLIELLGRIVGPNDEFPFHTGGEITQNVCEELLSTYKRRQKLGI